MRFPFFRSRTAAPHANGAVKRQHDTHRTGDQAHRSGDQAYWTGVHAYRTDDPEHQSGDHRQLCEMLSEYTYIASVGENGHVVIDWANEAFARITGFRKEELQLVPTWPMLIHPIDEELARTHRETVFRGETSLMPLRIVDSHGQTRTIMHLARPVLDEQGRLTRIFVVGDDVTERTEAAATLAAQQALLFSFNECNSAEEVCSMLVDAALRVNGYEFGGVYLRSTDPPGYSLTTHRGLSEAFTALASFHKQNSPHAALIDRGEPIFGTYRDVMRELELPFGNEPFHATAVIPLTSRKRVHGALNLASKSRGTTSAAHRKTLEVMAAAAALFIERIEAEHHLASDLDPVRSR